jgi:hypothetical protein
MIGKSVLATASREVAKAYSRPLLEDCNSVCMADEVQP